MKTHAILLSGGVDSAALAAVERPALAIGIDYGQRCAAAELTAAGAVAAALNIPFAAVRADCSQIGSGDLGARPALAGIAPSREWWPFRNQLLATLAAPAALEQEVGVLLFGSVSSDAFHSDGTAEFYSRLDALMRFQEGGIGVAAPGVRLTSVELVTRSGFGMELFGWTHSCHVANAPCGFCRGCTKRREVLREAGLWP
ncbi:MAG: 7-cyano-7-deazaguanine synthase [Pseudonocardia sp.]|nr:7-cyano-7-deazaguanine synthase [Pseudonocardia sp.]